MHGLIFFYIHKFADEASKGGKFTRPRLPQPRMERLEATLETALALPEEEWPKVIRGVRIRSTKEQVDRFNQLREHRDKVAREIDGTPVAPGRVQVEE